MKSKVSRRVMKLLRLIEEKQEDIIKCEEEIVKARSRLENRERGWTKAKYTKVKMKYSEKIRGLRGTINRLEKQRLNIERSEREKELEEQELDEWEESLAAEEERLLMKERKAKRSKKKAKKKKKKKAVKREEAVVEKKALSAEEKRMVEFGRTFVASYRSLIKSEVEEKKARLGLEIYGKYPYHVTVVHKAPEVVEEEVGEGEEKKKVVRKAAGPSEAMLVFSSPRCEGLKVDTVEEKDFVLSEYKDIFRTVLVQVKNWSKDEAKAQAEEQAARDMP